MNEVFNTITYHVASNRYNYAEEICTDIRAKIIAFGVFSDVAHKIVIGLYEAVINMISHAGGGEVILQFRVNDILINVQDNGPGIPNLKLAFKDGYTTATDFAKEHGFGAGIGLSNIRKFCDNLKIKTKVGFGTQISICCTRKVD